ncbi:LysR family transcriptional regulator [Bowmanella pacifica]|uniref:LysR family transcriptional regulator n=2 Tax=Bowmanella pacifica TaxID=502051 RepID=A0A917Z3J4_9ALTE|nr:LysR family transcriptional regulator [Bowmanella pacifica]
MNLIHQNNMTDHLPSLNALRVFASAARLGSFKQAADALHLTPTAVSHQVRNLESWLGQPLFTRHTRRVTLTPAGEKLATVTSNSLFAIAQAIQELKQQPKRLIIDCTSSFAALWLLPRLNALQTFITEPLIEIRSGEQLAPPQFGNGLAIRFGEVSNQQNILSQETFNLYGTASLLAAFVQGEVCNILLPIWKNATLPAAPWQAFSQQLPAHSVHCPQQHFDQELFAIQQAQAGQGLVFCGHTLMQDVNGNQLLPVSNFPGIPSSLGYYLKNYGEMNGKLQQACEWLQRQ